jgi:hypothetical protein
MEKTNPLLLKFRSYAHESSYLILAFIFLLIFLIYALNINLLLTPWHVDDYFCYAISDNKLSIIFQGVRPLANFYTWLCGQFSFETMMAGFVFIGLFYIVIARRAIESLLKLQSSILPSMVFLIICIFSKDFFFSFSYDIPSRLAGVFALFFMAFFYKSLMNAKNIYTSALPSLVFFFASGLSKETYLISMFMWGLLVSLFFLKSIKGTVYYGLLLLVLSFIVLKWSSLSGPFVNVHATVSDPYFIERNPISILENFWKLLWVGLGISGSVMIAISISICMVFYYLKFVDRHQINMLGMILIFGLLSYIPNSLLSHHYFPIYHLVSTPFLYAPTFFSAYLVHNHNIVPRIFRIIVVAGMAIVICSISIHDFKKQYDWYIFQDNLAQNLIEGLIRSQSTLQEYEKIAVIGTARDQVEMPFLPWAEPKAINNLCGCVRNWTIFANNDKVIQNVSFEKSINFPGNSDATIFLGEHGTIDRVWNSYEMSRFRLIFPNSKIGQFLYFESIRTRVEEIISAPLQERNRLLIQAKSDFSTYKFLTMDASELISSLQNAVQN